MKSAKYVHSQVAVRDNWCLPLTVDHNEGIVGSHSVESAINAIINAAEMRNHLAWLL